MSAVARLAAALLEIGGDPGSEGHTCLICHRWASDCDHILTHPHHNIRAEDPFRCQGAIARAALKAWRERPALRDDAELVRQCADAAYGLHGASRFTGPATPSEYVRACLAAIDAHLGRPATPTTTPRKEPA